MVENIYVAKFLGVAKLMLSLLEKGGLKRLSSYILIFLTAVPISFGWILIGKIYTQGLDLACSWGVVALAVVFNTAPVIFYIARTMAPLYSKQKFLEKLGITIGPDQLKKLMQDMNDVDVDSLTQPKPISIHDKEQTILKANETLHAEFTMLKQQMNELITQLKKDPPTST